MLNYASGETPRAGDLVRFLDTTREMIVSMVFEECDGGVAENFLVVGPTRKPAHLAVLIARHGEPAPTTS
jgi:hypothetical protein